MNKKKPKIINKGSPDLNLGTNNKNVGKASALIIEDKETYLVTRRVIRNTKMHNNATS